MTEACSISIQGKGIKAGTEPGVKDRHYLSIYLSMYLNAGQVGLGSSRPESSRPGSRSGLKAPAKPSCRPALFIFQYHPLWRFFKNKSYLKSSHRLKAISGTLTIIVNSYNLDLITISLRLLKMTIELDVAFRKMTIFVKLTNF